MKVFVIGDIVGAASCVFVSKILADFKKKHNIDLVIANGENCADGNGILPQNANLLFNNGVDIITTGNHALRRKEIYDMLDEDIGLIRPANFHKSSPGKGYYIFDTSKFKACVINLQGRIYMRQCDNPFDEIDAILKKTDCNIVIVDFHAEATSEKMAMGYYLDGKVSLVYGTHTHVQTADEKILPKGTGYISDVGMCGGYHSILGVNLDIAIQNVRSDIPTRFENVKESICLNGLMCTIDNKTGKTIDILRINIKE